MSLKRDSRTDSTRGPRRPSGRKGFVHPATHSEIATESRLVPVRTCSQQLRPWKLAELGICAASSNVGARCIKLKGEFEISFFPAPGTRINKGTRINSSISRDGGWKRPP